LEADTNRDGSISYNEFKNFCLKHKKTSKDESKPKVVDIWKQEKTENFDYLFSIYLVGQPGVGKSCLVLRFADNTFAESFISTIGVDFKIRTIDLDGQTVKLKVWDTYSKPDSEMKRRLNEHSYRNSHGIMLVYDVTDASSLNEVRHIVAVEIDRYCNDKQQKMLVATKIDLVDQRKVSKEDAEELAEQAKLTYSETSSKQDVNVSDSFVKLARQIKEKFDS